MMASRFYSIIDIAPSRTWSVGPRQAILCERRCPVLDHTRIDSSITIVIQAGIEAVCHLSARPNLLSERFERKPALKEYKWRDICGQMCAIAHLRQRWLRLDCHRNFLLKRKAWQIRTGRLIDVLVIAYMRMVCKRMSTLD